MVTLSLNVVTFNLILLVANLGIAGFHLLTGAPWWALTLNLFGAVLGGVGAILVHITRPLMIQYPPILILAGIALAAAVAWCVVAIGAYYLIELLVR